LEITIPDIINGVFESTGGFFVLLSIMRLYKDKKVRGLHWNTVAFFTSWGIWNMYYYYHLHQWVSWLGGFSVVSMNCTWLIMIFYYLRKDKNNENG
jgi:hypothetical protein